MTRSRWFALLTLGFGVSLVIMDATIVNVALPVVLEELDLTAADTALALVVGLVATLALPKDAAAHSTGGDVPERSGDVTEHAGEVSERTTAD